MPDQQRAGDAPDEGDRSSLFSDEPFVPTSMDDCTCHERQGYPMALGRRVFWGRTPDERFPITLPVTKVVPIYNHGDPLHGFMATLATENGVEVILTYDPHEQPPEATDVVYLFLHVVHPVTGNACSARIEGDRAVYDAWCGDEDNCQHEHGGWCEAVSSPADVFDRLPHLGRLTIKARIERPAHVV